MLIKVINFILFQLGWFVLVIQHNLVAIYIGLALFVLNLILIYKSYRTLLVCCLIAMAGITNDAALGYFHILFYPEQQTIIPYWLIVLWFLFSTVVPCSLSWTAKLPIALRSAVGGLGGAAAYVAGAKLGEVQFIYDNQFYAFAFHFCNWAVLFPIFTKLCSLAKPEL